MNRILLAAAALMASAVHAQPMGQRQPPNPDANGDGKVTLAEFKAAGAERHTRMFARMDANKDGKITQAEVDAAPKPGHTAGHKGGKGGQRGGMVTRMDLNKDGAVTEAELTAMTERRFQMADSNKDGWLSKEELPMMRQRRGGPGAQ